MLNINCKCSSLFTNGVIDTEESIQPFYAIKLSSKTVALHLVLIDRSRTQVYAMT